MSSVPAFSVFSALSELFVTAVVLYTIVANLRGQPFQWKLLGGVLVFELIVNIVYMAGRAAEADRSTAITSGMRLLYATHGILSLVMFLGLVVVFLLAVTDEKAGRPTWFRRHAGLTWGMLGLWIISVASGEAIFVLRYCL